MLVLAHLSGTLFWTHSIVGTSAVDRLFWFVQIRYHKGLTSEIFLLSRPCRGVHYWIILLRFMLAQWILTHFSWPLPIPRILPISRTCCSLHCVISRLKNPTSFVIRKPRLMIILVRIVPITALVDNRLITENLTFPRFTGFDRVLHSHLTVLFLNWNRDFRPGFCSSSLRDAD